MLGAAIAVAAWYLGMDMPHAAGLGAAVLALAACLSAVGEAAAVAWVVPPDALRPGSRRDVAQLAWSLGARGGRATPEGVRRLRAIAGRALALHGVALDDPACEADVVRLLGSDTAALLRRGSTVVARPAAVRNALTAVELVLDDQRPRPTAADGPSRPHPAEEIRHAR